MRHRLKSRQPKEAAGRQGNPFFLRQELLVSWATPAKLHEVTEQTVYRRESGKSETPKSAEALARLLYQEVTL